MTEFRPATVRGLVRGLRVVPPGGGPEFTRGPSVPPPVRRLMRAAHARRRTRIADEELRAAMAQAKARAKALTQAPPPPDRSA